ncbi:helix-turn-helix domain-containing protein [Pseudomonas viridiflava]|uniref:helix-turn-helix domain-containing protein n=1 Tax=Pseudomonas syringae group TaxID=136849 RepID=UPI000F04B475
MNIEQLGRQINTARKSRRISLKTLAKSTGVHYSQISRIERGEAVFISKNLRKVCEFLSISTSVVPKAVTAEDLKEKVQGLVNTWPQSEQLIWSILEGVQAALERGRGSR